MKCVRVAVIIRTRGYNNFASVPKTCLDHVAMISTEVGI